LTGWDELVAVGRKIALKLVVNLKSGGRIARATGQEKRDYEGRQGFHLEML
jgi:hypothetical protein